ncbi:MAG: hypothetical protein FGM32_10370 [Candidatus Kapabacteria bacterium]|nr:hypothetical protein [Candidatus Kapabacteria bacterium]
MIPISPAIDERNVSTSGAKLRYTVLGTNGQYEVLLSRGLADPAPRRKIADSVGLVTFDSLLPSTRYFWRVIEKTTYADTGALGMFTTGSETSRVESSTSRELSVLCHGRQVHIEAPFPVAAVFCVDALGRTAVVDYQERCFENGLITFSLPEMTTPMFGLWIVDGKGRSSFRWLNCNK